MSCCLAWWVLKVRMRLTGMFICVQPKVFTKEVIELMCELNKRPIIFPLSNPTHLAECTAEEAWTWSKGTVLFASGSPFPTMDLGGGKQFVPGQGNNAYIFPGVGLAVVVAGIKHVTDDMMRVAARALADQVSEQDTASFCLYPPLKDIRTVSCKIAAAVAEEAYAAGLASKQRPADLLQAAKSTMFYPGYEAIDLNDTQMDSEGLRVLRNPTQNLGLLMDKAQRAELGLLGVLPPVVSTMEVELARIRFQFDRIQKPLDKYTYLMGLQVCTSQCLTRDLCACTIHHKIATMLLREGEPFHAYVLDTSPKMISP